MKHTFNEDAFHPFITWHGRISASDHGIMFHHTASGFDLVVKGEDLALTFWSSYEEEVKKAYLQIDVLDGEQRIMTSVVALDKGQSTIRMTFERHGPYLVRVRKRSEELMSKTALRSIGTKGLFLDSPLQDKRPLVECIGDSTTCGYGNLGAVDQPFTTETEDGLDTYITGACRLAGASCVITCYSGIGIYKSIYATKTMPSVYPMTDFEATTPSLQTISPDIIVLNLGTNDNTYFDHLVETSRNYETERFKETYTGFIRSMMDRHPDAMILVISQDKRQPHVQDAIKDVVKTIADSRVTHLALSSIASNEGIGSQYHPSVTTHRKWASELAQTLKTITRTHA